MSGLNITPREPAYYHSVYGDMRGGHIRVLEWKTGATAIYIAHYANGEDGILLNACGQGFTAEEAVRGLWKALHP